MARSPRSARRVARTRPAQSWQVASILRRHSELAEAAEAEAAETAAALEVPLNLRIDRKLDSQLRQRAAAAQIPTSALVRRLLRQAMREPDAPVLTEERVEAIARRVLAETKGE